MAPFPSEGARYGLSAKLAAPFPSCSARVSGAPPHISYIGVWVLRSPGPSPRSWSRHQATNEMQLFFELQIFGGTTIPKIAGLWPSAKDLQSLRLGFGFGWGREWSFPREIPVQNRRRFDFSRDFAGGIPGFLLPTGRIFLCRSEVELVLNDFLQPRITAGSSSAGRDIITTRKNQ